MIIVTGSNGFIGANIVARLNERGRDDIVAVDHFSKGIRYLDEMKTAAQVEKDDLRDWLTHEHPAIDGVVHMGACSDTTVTDREYVMRVNYEYTRMLWQWCAAQHVPLIYASSAATYGDGSQGYDDTVDPSRYQPLNLYGESKQRFDLWALERSESGAAHPPRWAGVKYFNVYGPREGHKGRMASVALHAYRQINDRGRVSLFQSHKPGIADGGQQRDFIYVMDAVDATLFLLDAPVSDRAPNGLYNIGTGEARTFADLARAVFAAMGREPAIDYIPMPQDLRGKYQYFTEARIDKLRQAGFTQEMHTLEQGVSAYVEWLSQP